MDPKALLDELMGKDRDLPLGHKRKNKLRFDDPEVCHYHLVAFCPHDLFPNTKSDLGPCKKVHDETLREEFFKSNRVSQYETEFLRYLERLIADLERKIRRCYERLEKEIPLLEHSRVNSDRIAAIAAEVQGLLKQAEREGEEGLVDRAEVTMSKVDMLNKEKDQILRAAMPEYGSIVEKEKRMQVCEVCGAMQATTDTEKRLASHLEGRQHVGYLKIRQMLEELRKKREEAQEAKRRERDMEKFVSSNQDKIEDTIDGKNKNGMDREHSRDEVAEHRNRRKSRSPERDVRSERIRYRDRYTGHRDRYQDRERDRSVDVRGREHGGDMDYRRRSRSRDRGRERR